MARHSTGGRVSGRRRAAGAILLITSLGIAGAVTTQLVSRGAPFSAGDARTDCSARPVTVTTSREILPVVKAAADRVSSASPCARFTVTSATGTGVAALINARKGPDVWVPDSSTWLDNLTPADGSPRWAAGSPIARTPVVLAQPVVAGQRPLAAPASWSSVLNLKGVIRMANPDRDTASRLAYLASRVGQKEELTIDTGARLIFTSRFARPSVVDLFSDLEANPHDSPPFPASEQSVATYAAAHPNSLRALYPRSGSMSLDYPFLTSPLLPSDLSTSVDALRTQLGSAATKADLATAGFRGLDNSGGPTIDRVPAPYFTEIPVLAEEQRAVAIEQWDVLRTDMRMLAVIDVSGSMKYPAAGTRNQTRAQVAQNSAVKALRILPAGSAIGAWIFSTNKGGKGIDWQERAAVKRLDAPGPGAKGTWRDHLITLTQQIPAHLGGDTGLYDTTYAALKKMTAEFDPNYVNSVVIMTDGKNDDPTGGLSFEQLMVKIRTTWNPERPVRIITVGMGEADPVALGAIAKATGGSSYIANTPADIERVFVAALLARVKHSS